MGLFEVISVELVRPCFSRNLCFQCVPGVESLIEAMDSAAHSSSVVMQVRNGFQLGGKGKALRQKLSGNYCH